MNCKILQNFWVEIWVEPHTQKRCRGPPLAWRKSRKKKERMNVMSTATSSKVQNGLELQIGDLLRRIGISGKLSGHKHLTESIAQTVHDPNRIRYITKDLYPDLAKLYGSTASKVERAMRTAIKVWWRSGDRKLFEDLIGFELSQRPTNSEFIDLLANYFRHHI